MVISIETTLQHPRRGYIKLEDTLAVTDDGWEAFGDRGRGWNRGGVQPLVPLVSAGDFNP
jgi:Xaa-Pro aminopeptidase